MVENQVFGRAGGGDRVRQLIPKNIPVSQTEDFVCKALEHYNKFLRNRAERDSR